MVAQEQHEWTEAEHCYRESLAIEERLGNFISAAKTSNQLAIVAQESGRPAEAEGWYRRTLQLDERAQPGKPNASHLSNLAALLVSEVQAGRAPNARLAEAKRFAQQALAIFETLETSSEIWTMLGILADIAESEGQAKEAQIYRRRAYETYAAFEGNRYNIDLQHRQRIANIAAGAHGDTEAQEVIEAVLPELEAKGWKI